MGRNQEGDDLGAATVLIDHRSRHCRPEGKSGARGSHQPSLRAKNNFTLKYLEKPLIGLNYLEFGVRPEPRGRRSTDAGSGNPACRVGNCLPVGPVPHKR